MAFAAADRCSRRAFLATLGMALLGSPARAEDEALASGADPSAPLLVLLPLGAEIADSDMDFVKKCLEAFYNYRIEMAKRAELPRHAYYAPRKRYRAEKLLDYLDGIVPSRAARILGLTAVDISTTKGKVFDWGILGLATLDGRVGVLSSFRCQRGIKSPSEAQIRFGKTAVHEFGHTLGLDHCPSVGCLMEDGRGTVSTTDREYELCPRCRKRLIALGRAARNNPVIPWPKPNL